MKVALAIAASLVVAGLAASAALAQEPIVPPPGVEPGVIWPAPNPKTKKFDIAFYVETLPGNGSGACRQTNTFERGQRAVWHIGAINARKGTFVLPKDIKYAYVQIPGVSKNFGVTFVPHGRDPVTAPWTWTARWDIPNDYPLGQVQYKVVFKLKGWPANKVATFTPLPLGGSTMTVVPKR